MATLKKKSTKSVTKTKEGAEKEFSITVSIEQSVYKGEGTTALEALQSVPAPATDLISSGLVRIAHGEKFKEMFFNSMRMRRLLNPHNMEVLINDLQDGL